MKRYHISLVLILLSLFSCQHISKDLPGKGAEDLWGSQIRLNREIDDGKSVVIVPFSTSNCGYCMIDGYFTEANYIGNNNRFGGSSYHMSLFNPQLDIYAFQKHFGWHSSILTYPPSLHEYHRNGFPTLLAFKDGEQVLRDFDNYAKFDTLKSFLWDSMAYLIPTGELHMATRLIYENMSNLAVCVISDTSTIEEDEHEFTEKYNAYTFSSFASLSQEDKQKHLYIRVGFDLSALKSLFEGEEIPLRLEKYSFGIGNYQFLTDTVAFYGCFPNPFNPEKYVVLAISSGYPKLFWPTNYLDYLVFSGDRPASGKRLLFGHFDKEDPAEWHFSEDRSFSDVSRDDFCINKCETSTLRNKTSNAAPDIETSFRSLEEGAIWRLGNGPCRFPEIAAGTDGSCWVTWEQEGNILLGQINPEGEVKTWFVENNESDSYNPKLVVQDNEIQIFYLNKQDHYYRLVARSFDGGRFTGEVLLTHGMPVDVVTPECAAGSDGTVTIAWCEWMANQRFLRYLKMKNGIPGEIKDILVTQPIYTKDYTNAWWPSLVSFGDEIWGAWNQHYPAVCGIYGGALQDSSRTITQPSEAMDDREWGGYPDIFTDGNELFVVWESDGFNVFYTEEPQQVKIAKYDTATGRWTPGKVLTAGNLTTLNQTPVGACDSKGNKYVVWSGRDHLSNGTWGIYLAKETLGKWSDPILLTGKEETARHPKITIGSDDRMWISWHGGNGENMRTLVLTMVCE